MTELEQLIKDIEYLKKLGVHISFREGSGGERGKKSSPITNCSDIILDFYALDSLDTMRTKVDLAKRQTKIIKERDAGNTPYLHLKKHFGD